MPLATSAVSMVSLYCSAKHQAFPIYQHFSIEPGKQHEKKEPQNTEDEQWQGTQEA